MKVKDIWDTSSRICVRARKVNLSWISARILSNVGRIPAKDSLRLLSCSPMTSTLRISTSSQRTSKFVSWISFGRSVSYRYVHLQSHYWYLENYTIFRRRTCYYECMLTMVSAGLTTRKLRKGTYRGSTKGAKLEISSEVDGKKWSKSWCSSWQTYQCVQTENLVSKSK